MARELPKPHSEGELTLYQERVRLRTDSGQHFIDVTDLLAERVRRSGIELGAVSIHSLHTTAAIVVNEHEPRLIRDLDDLLERLAPRSARYRHNDLHARRFEIPPDERPNAHAHARQLLIGGTPTIHLVEGRMMLGRWQRVFLVELDGPREREVSILVQGLRAPAPVRRERFEVCAS